jgi:hypothetical protein
MALWRSGVILTLNVPLLSKTQYFRFRLLQLFKQALSRRIGEALPIFYLLIYWRGRIHILNRRGGSNLQDDYSVYIASPNQKVN